MELTIYLLALFCASAMAGMPLNEEEPWKALEDMLDALHAPELRDHMIVMADQNFSNGVEFRQGHMFEPFFTKTLNYSLTEGTRWAPKRFTWYLSAENLWIFTEVRTPSGQKMAAFFEAPQSVVEVQFSYKYGRTVCYIVVERLEYVALNEIHMKSQWEMSEYDKVHVNFSLLDYTNNNLDNVKKYMSDLANAVLCRI